MQHEAGASTDADGRYALAVEADHQGDGAAALAAVEATLRIDPNHARALALLGLFQIRDGHRRLGSDSQERAASIAPEDPEVQHLVGVGRWECDDGLGAIEALTRAIEGDQPHPRGAAVLAQILELSNRLDEAQAVLDRFGVVNPASQLLRARLSRRADDCEEAIGILDRIDTAAGGADPRLIHAERGRCLELVGRTEEAWQQFKLANEIAAQRSTHPPIGAWFDRLAVFHRQRASRPGGVLPPSTQGSTDRAGGAVDADSWAGPAAFIVGFPRSGTTLIESLLTSDPRVTSTREVEAIARAVTHVCASTGRGYLQLLNNPQPSDPEAIRVAYSRVLDEHLIDRSTIVIDKLPLNVLYLGAIELAFPDSSLIVARRHPADAVLSAYIEQFADNAGMAQLNSLEGAARLHNSVIDLWEAVRATTTMNWIEVDYQRLVTDAQAETKLISDFLGLGLDPTALLGTRTTSARINTPSYTEASGPAHRRSVGRWKGYRRQLAPVLGTLGITA